jgi:NADH-quinone oxidoreductase subunit L
MADYAYLIPLFPLAGAILIFFFGRWLPWKGSLLGVAAVFASMVMSISLFHQYLNGTLKVPFELSWSWFAAGIYPFEVGVLLDGPSLILLLVVTVVSFLVQFYSLGYMRDSPRFKRFFSYLSFFTFSMLGLVVANNYLQFFVCWEVVGLCSYLLIGFEFERDAAAGAGNKAFLTTKLGDLGFYAGLLLIFAVMGTFNFGQITTHLQDGSVSPRLAMIIGLLIFCGTIGKSAQFPLHVWLPDAMEGPTPVSALIHAATMVAAGVYLLARAYPFFMLAPEGLEIVAWVGGITAVFAATIALTSDDIKKILAYSTISQLGYMVMALGVSGYGAGLFHLTTHAAFKALLFLAAGSVIHAVHTNDIWKMGSLSKQMVTTTITFFIGAAALAGVPGLAGFYSKEMILGAAYGTQHHALFALGCLGAFMTALYMMRACSLVFLGEPRDRERFTHAHESPWTMTIPLMILAALSVVAGKLLLHNGLINRLMEMPGISETRESGIAAVIATSSALLGIILGYGIYLARWIEPKTLAAVFRPAYVLFRNKWFIDEIYWALFVRPIMRLADKIASFDYDVLDQIGVDGFGAATEWFSKLDGWIDDTFVDGFVDGTGRFVSRMGAMARTIQTGLVQNYLLIITAGFVFLAIFWKIF